MIRTDDIILRDFIKEDIEKRIHWELVENEWQLWDAPWEYEHLTALEIKEDLDKYIKTMHKWVDKYQQISKEQKRYTFQIATNDENKYIGWVSAYHIDDEYNFTDDEGKCAVGIDIPDMSVRGKGYSYKALCEFIKYLIAHGENEIFTQTWSGNKRMIHIAEKMGFEECCRKKDIRTVKGEKFDGLTFQLNRDKFDSFCGSVNCI